MKKLGQKKSLQSRHWWTRIGVTVTILSLILTGCGSAASGTSATGGNKQTTLKVGVIDSYTGGAAVYAKEALEGFKLAISESEAKGGPKIEVVTRDDEFKVDKATSWAKELVLQQRVDVLAGTINSAGSLAVSQYAKENKTPFLVWGGMSEKITGANGHRYVFGMLPNTAIIGKAGAAQMAKTPHKNYWLAGSDYEYGRSVVNGLWSNLQKANTSVVKQGESWWRVGETDFTPYINAIRSAKPDAVVVGTGGADLVAFMKALQTTGLAKEIPVWIHVSTDATSLSPLGSEAPEGVLGTNPYFSYYPETPENKSFVEAFKKAYNREPASFALYGYLSGKFLVESVQKAGSQDKEKIVDALEGMTLDSPVGKVALRKEDHQIMLPMFYGTTAKVSGKVIAKDLVAIPAEKTMPSVEEVLGTRDKK
jgi:branched-chain amino acid transport system substrate-binding protein